MINEQNTLWSQTLLNKYGRGQEGLSVFEPKQGALEGEGQQLTCAKRGKIKVANGMKINFWEDAWVEETSLKCISKREVPKEALGRRVCVSIGTQSQDEISKCSAT